MEQNRQNTVKSRVQAPVRQVKDDLMDAQMACTKPAFKLIPRGSSEIDGVIVRVPRSALAGLHRSLGETVTRRPLSIAKAGFASG